MDSHTKKNEGFLHTLTRRGFIGKMIAAIAGMISVTLLLPLAGYTILPSLGRRAEKWIDIINPDQLRPNEPANIEVVISVQDGWMKTTSVKSVWAVRQDTGEAVIYSPLCTHLGCGYRWEVERQTFFCPCHGSVFDINGRVLAGPAPRPLDTLPSKVENGRLWVIYKEFKAGASNKIEL